MVTGFSRLVVELASVFVHSYRLTLPEPGPGEVGAHSRFRIHIP